MEFAAYISEMNIVLLALIWDTGNVLLHINYIKILIQKIQMISSLSFLLFVFGDNYFNKTGKKQNP